MKKSYKFCFFIFIIIGLLFSVSSIIYLFQNNTVDGYDKIFYYFFKSNSQLESILGALIYAGLIISSFFIYLKFIKKSNLFSIKQIFLMIFIIGIIFGIALPNTSSDIFYYMGTGRVFSKYMDNPYYTTVSDILEQNKNDEILFNTGPWKSTVVVYGPLWILITGLLNLLSFNSVTVLLYVFKFVSLSIHLFNCFMIYKITGKKKFVILYGLNPLILIEFLINVHNDIYVLCFMFLAIYFLKNKKNIWISLLMLLCSALIKHLTLILLPIFVLYYLRNEKKLKKIIFGCIYLIFFLGLMIIAYLPFLKNFKDIFSIVLGQQNKIKDSIYIFLYILTNNNSSVMSWIYSTLLMVMIYYYIVFLLKLFTDEIKFMNMMKVVNNLLLLFIFAVITNLTPWYLSWLFITIFWVKGKNIKTIIYIQMLYELSYSFFILMHDDYYLYGAIILPTIAIGLLIRFIYLKNKKNVKDSVIVENIT